MVKHKVLSTKKLEASLVDKARENAIEIIEQEFIAVKPINYSNLLQELIDLAMADVRHVVFTSQKAVYILDEILSEGNRGWAFAWWIFCLSGKTKEAVLSQSNYTRHQILGVADNSTSLAQVIIEKGIKEVIFFCGNKRRDELPFQLQNAGVKVHEFVIYETIETPTCNIPDLDAILFFSPSAVQSFFSVNQLKKETVCFAVGQTTANRITDFTDNKLIVSESPSQEAMLASVQVYFANSNIYE